jgi:hypothetical protein
MTTKRATPPDPSRIQDTPSLLAALRDFREQAGNPPPRKIAIACRQLVTATPIAAALKGDRLPPLRTVTAVLRGCGATGEYEAAFAEAWQRCRVPGDA